VSTILILIRFIQKSRGGWRRVLFLVVVDHAFMLLLLSLLLVCVFAAQIFKILIKAEQCIFVRASERVHFLKGAGDICFFA
jgi:hypothetical protein